ncbi:MAG: hypothetical protein QJR05_05870 [Thermoanaerobacterium sp.]|nr:hypothetical protein [Thermoanaerobacterium sp.]
MFGDYIFIQSDKVYKILFKKDIVPNFEKRLSEIKEFKSKLDNLSYNDLKLLRADIESKSVNASNSDIISVLIGTLLGYLAGKIGETNSLYYLIITILALLSLGATITYFMRYRSKMVFIKEIIDICLEEKNNKE